MPEHDSISRPFASSGFQPDSPLAVSSAALVRRQAHKLHLAARTGSISLAMPALRLLQSTDIFPGQALSTLYRQRQKLQRKHFLRALAVQAGFADWESLRPQLDQLPAEAFDHFKANNEWVANINAWFSDEQQAQAHAQQYGGRVYRVGTQAMVRSVEALQGDAD